MGLEVLEDETIFKLTEEVLGIIKEKIDMDNKLSKIVAVHRIPSKHDPYDCTDEYDEQQCLNQIYETKKNLLKQHDHKFVGDVTKKNTEPISRLLNMKKIEPVWFFNGFIFGKTTEGIRYRFDMYSSINAEISKETEGWDEEVSD